MKQEPVKIFSPLMIIAGIILLLLALVLNSTPAYSQVLQCGDREAIIKELKLKYQEERSFTGYTKDGTVLEILTARDDSWTAIVTYSTGISCLLQTGTIWRTEKKEIKGEKI